MTKPAALADFNDGGAVKTNSKDGPTTRLRAAVAQRVAGLQAEFLNDVPSARARLAQLRTGVGREAGSVPLIWEDTIEILDEGLRGRGDHPSPAETASHLALTMYALHQQGCPGRMHVSGVGVGAATKRLIASGAFSDPRPRR